MRRAGRAERRSLFGRILRAWGEAYRGETWRRIGRSVVAVPIAAREVARAVGRRPASPRLVARALVAVPVAISASALTAMLGFVVLINVVAYPFRGHLGLPGRTGDVWASTYDDSWGGPTLAGAWATHAAIGLLAVVPALALAVRGLIDVQRRLTAAESRPRTSTRAVRPAPAAQAVQPCRTRRQAVQSRRVRPQVVQFRRVRHPAGPRLLLRRVIVVAVAVALAVGSSLTAHGLGIGDNILWTPQDLASSLALAITVAPLLGLFGVARTRWWLPAR